MKLLLSLLVATALVAEDPAPKDAPAKKLFTEDRVSETEHSVTIRGREVDYTATAGTLVLKAEDGSPEASVFYTAYVRKGVEDTAHRPLTFCFNGGPGSSSVWLHLGLFGPRRVPLGELGDAPPAPPYALVDNGYSLLDVSDLVFIDPVTTGFSRAVPGEKDSEYHGVEKDIESVGEFIRLYTTRAERWGSPKYLAGESYGTTRAAGLAGHLTEEVGMYLNGIVLVSSILNFQTARFDPGNDLPYVLFLPTYSATAWYHGKLGPELSKDLRATLDEVEQFAMGEYNQALMLGNRLPDEYRGDIARRLARYTGLSEEYVRSTNLRIGIQRFTKELRRDERVTVGRLDSRFEGVDRDAAGEDYEFDPSYAGIQGAYTACLNEYVRGELGFESDLPYEILTGRVRPWSYERAKNRYLNVAETLRGAMARNPHLEVFVASGYYDLATPYFATEYTFDHFAFDPGFRERVRIEHYEAGHMMYVHEPSLARLRTDLVEFYAKGAGAE